MTAGYVVSDNFAPRFSEDNARLYLGTAPRAETAARARTRPRRRASISGATRIRRSSRCSRCAPTRTATRNYRAVVHLADKRFLQLATADLPTVNAGDDPVRALGTSDVPYQQEISWDQTYNDVYLVDLKTGTRKKILEHWGAARDALARRQLRDVLRREDGQLVHATRSRTASRVNLTGELPVKFFDESHDTPDAPPSLGIAGLDRGRQVGAPERRVRHLGNPARRHAARAW